MRIKFKDLFSEFKLPINLKVDLKEQVLGIDIYIMIYQMLAGIRRREEGGQEFTHEGRTTGHLIGLLGRSIYMLENKMKPIAVFDGQPVEFKDLTLIKRSENKQKAQENHEAAMAAGDLESAAKYAQATVQITDEIIDDSKRLFDLLGIPHLVAVHDAEAQIALMNQKGLINAAASQDYDTFAFGAPRIIRNITISQRRQSYGKTITVLPEQFYLDQILKGLEISREQLIYAGLLIGTDFNSGVKGVGPKTALKLVKKYPTLSELKEVIEDKYVTDEFPLDSYFEIEPEIIVDYFLNPPYAEVNEVKFEKVDKPGLIEFLAGERGFNKDSIESRLKKVLKLQRQSSLSSFF